MKILLLDIETAPNLAYVWGLWEQNVAINQIQESGYILCWAAKWLGEDEVFFSSRENVSERVMLRKIHKLLNEADAVVHYNGKRFDIPWLNGAFVRNGLTPPAPFKQIDLVETVKSKFRFPSNKLAYVCQVFGLGEKIKTDFDLWLGCMKDDPASWAEMGAYNRNDVVILEQLYHKLLPWIKGHINYSLYSDDAFVCPNCGSTHLVKRGFHKTLHSIFQRYRCQDCGKWCKDNKILNRQNYKTTGIE
jgi:hypothetical protein